MLRVSGPAVPAIAARVLGDVPPPRYAALRAFLDTAGQPIDRGLALYFPAPASYTGEDVLELHGHGGPVVTDLVLARLLALGARHARPGEFTERAFLNGRIDLVQAEAVADLIDAATAAAARAARRTLDGEWSRQLSTLGEALTDLRAEVEAGIDFPDEDLDPLDVTPVRQRAQDLLASLGAALATAARGRVLAEGLRVVIAGRPNAGKSSLLNALAGQDCAIVTDVPGTTRDAVRASIQVGGIPVHLTDTAGLRATDDPVERIGVERAWTAAREADLVLLVVDAKLGFGGPEEEIVAGLPAELPKVVVWNKVDLTDDPAGRVPDADGRTVRVSAKTGAGLGDLRKALREASGQSVDEGLFSARRRHLEALERVRGHLAEVVRLANGLPPAEILAEELRQAQRAVGEVVGTVTGEDVLDRIFSRFCIGK